jgi:DNA modification methylase
MYNIIQGDCLQEMDKLIGNGIKVDLILTDPPYGTTQCKDRKSVV